MALHIKIQDNDNGTKCVSIDGIPDVGALSSLMDLRAKMQDPVFALIANTHKKWAGIPLEVFMVVSVALTRAVDTFRPENPDAGLSGEVETAFFNVFRKCVEDVAAERGVVLTPNLYDTMSESFTDLVKAYRLRTGGAA